MKGCFELSPIPDFVPCIKCNWHRADPKGSCVMLDKEECDISRRSLWFYKFVEDGAKARITHRKCQESFAAAAVLWSPLLALDYTPFRICHQSRCFTFPNCDPASTGFLSTQSRTAHNGVALLHFLPPPARLYRTSISSPVSIQI